jgi:hypothetical protein
MEICLKFYTAVKVPVSGQSKVLPKKFSRLRQIFFEQTPSGVPDLAVP